MLRSTLTPNDMFVVFLVYPGVCNQTFSMFNCRVLDSVSVLAMDYSVVCGTPQHGAYQSLAGIVVIAFSLGIPLGLVGLMMRRMREYGEGTESDRFVARRVADDLKLDDHVAADAIRDVSTGREYSFLVNAYK